MTAPVCQHMHLAQPEWGHAEHGAFTVLLTCKNCGATTVIDLGDVASQDWRGGEQSDIPTTQRRPSSSDDTRTPP